MPHTFPQIRSTQQSVGSLIYLWWQNATETGAKKQIYLLHKQSRALPHWTLKEKPMFTIIRWRCNWISSYCYGGAEDRWDGGSGGLWPRGKTRSQGRGRGLLGVCNWYLPSIPRGQEFSKKEVGHFKPVGLQWWLGFSITVLTGSVGIEVIIWGLESYLVPYYQV